jgi:hypothetical protein
MKVKLLQESLNRSNAFAPVATLPEAVYKGEVRSSRQIPKPSSGFGVALARDGVYLRTGLQCFVVKSNLTINLRRFADHMIVHPGREAPEWGCYPCSGTIVALKHRSETRGAGHLFKKKSSFKNSVQLIMSFRTIPSSSSFVKEGGVRPAASQKRIKNLINIKISSVGTFQVFGVQMEDVSKIVFKLFTLMEKQNRYDIFTYYVAPNSRSLNRPEGDRPEKAKGAPNAPNTSVQQTYTSEKGVYTSEKGVAISHDFEIVISNILANYVLELDPHIVTKLYSNPTTTRIFKKHDFLCFKIPTDHAITIKKSFEYDEFKTLPVAYITYKRRGKIERFIEYDSFNELRSKTSPLTKYPKKYVNIRVFRTGKAIVSGFHQMLVERVINEFLYILEVSHRPEVDLAASELRRSAKCALILSVQKNE